MGVSAPMVILTIRIGIMQMAEGILDTEPRRVVGAKGRPMTLSDENLFWSDEENGWVVGRPSRGRPANAGRKRAAPDGLPHRLYERKGKRLVTWWMKDPDNRTRTVHSVPASASEEELSAARQHAIQRASRPTGRVNRDPFRPGANWVANFGRSEPEALVVRKGLPQWARAIFRGARKGAQARNIDWLLSTDDMAAIAERCGGLCEVSGVALTFTATGRRGPYGPSVDRIDANFAYTPRNTRIVCIAINYAMNTWGAEPLIPIVQAMAEKYRNKAKEPPASSRIASQPKEQK